MANFVFNPAFAKDMEHDFSNDTFKVVLATSTFRRLTIAENRVADALQRRAEKELRAGWWAAKLDLDRRDM